MDDVMKRLVIHIGASKCGSSSLQNYLSMNFTGRRHHVNKDGETVAYAAIKEDAVLLGDDLRANAEASPSRYSASVAFTQLDTPQFAERIAELQRTSEGIDVVILSSEGWAREGSRQRFQENAGVIRKLGVPLQLIYISRPPVELMNSAWWQWGAWSGLSVEEWCRIEINRGNFMSHLAAWSAALPDADIAFIELSQNPVAETLRVIGFDPGELPEPRRINEATNSNLLRHLISMRKHYGREVHKPAIEFRLNNVTRLQSEKPPFVIPGHLAKLITEASRESSIQILELISRRAPVGAEVARRYIDAGAYAEVPDGVYEKWVSQGHSDAFVSELIDRMLKLDASAAKARHELRRAEKQLEAARQELSALKSTVLVRSLRQMERMTQSMKQFMGFGKKPLSHKSIGKKSDTDAEAPVV